MKNLSFILIPFLLIALLFASCTEQDDCADITCLNGGTCESGVCDCPDGYSGDLCAVYDSCINVLCMNGGTCLSGVCDCADGYSGTDCSTVLASTKMTITKIVVNSYPTTRANGQTWDAADDADALVTFSLGTTGSNSGYSSETINNVTGSALEFTANLPTNTAAAHTIDWNISLWDEDASTRELISTIPFKPSAYSDGAPATFELSNSDINVTVHATWEF